MDIYETITYRDTGSESRAFRVKIIERIIADQSTVNEAINYAYMCFDWNGVLKIRRAEKLKYRSSSLFESGI